MVQIATIAFAAVALVGQALAAPTGTTCIVGQFYCGYTLLNNGTFPPLSSNDLH